jgi:hypothetical protein
MYMGKDEEGLRDELLVHLRLHFPSTSGETFNKLGKTDILVSHDGGTVFVAECKFWAGEKSYLEAVSQLLGYLTWRDSKAALVLFVTNVGMQTVLDQLPVAIRAHSNFLKDRSNPSQGWFRFEMHVEKDVTRSIHLAVLYFHFPALK